MASIHETKAGYAIHWRFAGKQFQQTADVSRDDPEARKKAEAAKGRVEETVRLLKSGTLALPEGADYEATKRFIFSGGKKAAREEVAVAREVFSLGGLFDLYWAGQPSNEESTLYTEKVHQGHILRILGEGRGVESLALADIQSYVDVRKGGYTHRKKSYAKVGRDTILKELKTLGKVWNWAVHRDLLARAKPWEVKKLTLPKAAKRERFRDYDEISEILREDGLSPEEAAKFWECLYLRGQEVAELLDHVEANASAPFAYPMFALCALTGCRRSEAIRALNRDVDLKKKIITIREKKKDATQDFTTRDVPMNARLFRVMNAWKAAHPGGKYLIADEEGRRITIRSGRLDREFEATLKGSKFSVMRGWHCLRHSFASILASKGRDQRVINKLMGHLDEKTVERYRHLYKETGRDDVEALLS